MSATSAWALGSWASLAPVPSVGPGVEGMSVGVTGKAPSPKITAAFGYDGGAGGDTVTTRIYDIATDTWSAGADGPAPVRSEAVAVIHHFPFGPGRVYSLGGRGPAGVLADVDRYTPTTDAWLSLPDMPTARAGLAAAVVGNAIYAIGGRTTPGGPCGGGELATVEKFDISSSTWSTVASLPSARSDLAAAVVGGKIYVFGGCAGGVFLDDADVYNPATGTWSTAPADLPAARAAFYQVAGLADGIHVIGGYAGGPALPDHDVYSVATDSYTAETPMMTPRGEMGVVARAGKIYTVGGAFPAFGLSASENEVFTP